MQLYKREVNDAAKTKEMRDLMVGDGSMPVAVTLEQTGRSVRDDYALWKKLAAEKQIATD